jgi:hypothetical protein
MRANWFRRELVQRGWGKAVQRQAPIQRAVCGVEMLERRVLLSGSGVPFFVTNADSSTIAEYNSSGSTVKSTLISGLSAPAGIAVSGTLLFVVSFIHGTIGEYTTSGAKVNASLITGLSFPQDIAVSGTQLFVTESTGIVEYTTSGATVNASLVSDTNGEKGIAISGTNLFVADNSTDTIGEYTTSGSTVNAALISGLNGPFGLATDGTLLLVVNQGTLSITDDGTVGEYTTSGTTVNSTLISGLNVPYSIAVLGGTTETDASADLVSGLDLPADGSSSGANIAVSDSGGIALYQLLVNAGFIKDIANPYSPTWIGGGFGQTEPSGSATLVVTKQPASGTAGAAIKPVVVDIENANKKIVTSDNTQVTLSINSGPGGWTTGTTLTATAVNGVATFSSLIFNTSGSYTLSVSDSADTFGPIVSNTFDIAPLPADRIFFGTLASSVTAGALQMIPVSVLDAFGNPVANGTSVKLAIESGPLKAKITGTTTEKTIDGTATFPSVILNTSGTVALKATAGKATGTSTAETVNTGAPAKVEFVGKPPKSGKTNTALDPYSLQVTDKEGNVIFGATVTVTESSGPSGGLGGTTSANTDSGTATFGTLLFSQVGKYGLDFDAGSAPALQTTVNIGD